MYEWDKPYIHLVNIKVALFSKYYLSFILIIMTCWLCTFQGEQLGRKLHDFIIKHIGIMDMHCISHQVSDFLVLSEPGVEGSSKEIVYEHISRHMLNPRVRMAVMLRQLLDFCALLQTSLVVNDTSAGICTVDKSNAELYLKVIGQIMTLYKADTQGMLFADDDKNDSSVKDTANAS
jgi:hypothetical protein